MSLHDEHCSCAPCRHARFAPGAPSRRRQVANFYGHRSYHLRHSLRDGPPFGRFGVGSAQTRGPINYGPVDFLRGASSTNKYLSAPAPTLRWITGD